MPNLCPACSFSRSWIIRRKKRKCKRCRREFSIHQYPITGIRSTMEAWQQCVNAFLVGRTVRRVMAVTGIPRCRSLAMIQRIRQVMAGDTPPVFQGPVELDETYIGGQRKNKKLHIRRIQGKRGHGTDKLPIVGLFDRSSGAIVVVVEPRKLDMQFILRLVGKRAAPGAAIYTDGFKMYRMLKGAGYQHAYVDHDAGELVRDTIHTNNIEGYWGILKRTLGCIGGIRRSRLPLFVGELVWRFNHRRLPYAEQESILLILVLRG